MNKNNELIELKAEREISIYKGKLSLKEFYKKAYDKYDSYKIIIKLIAIIIMIFFIIIHIYIIINNKKSVKVLSK